MVEHDMTGGDARSVLDRVAARSAAQMGAENFPVALRVLPKTPRDRLQRVYAYARFVDDVGDEASGDRLELLDLVEKDVRAMPDAGAQLPVVAALRPLLDQCGAPIEAFLDLIEANRQDQQVTAYATFEDLIGYCFLSAAPIGRLVLHIAGAPTRRNLADSDTVCNALQVLEHCQDVREDALAGRVYLPAEDLAAAGVTRSDLTGTQTSPAVRDVVAIQVARSVEMLRAGRPLVGRLSGWARVAVAGYVAGGLATADALTAADYDVLPRLIKPGTGRTAWHAARLWVNR